MTPVDHTIGLTMLTKYNIQSIPTFTYRAQNVIKITRSNQGFDLTLDSVIEVDDYCSWDYGTWTGILPFVSSKD
jgi:hypothetical protein